MEFTLDAAEVRVLGALVEKELSTPEYYPMTVNALTAACNQKSNRDPVMALSDEVVGHALEALQRKRLAGVASGAYSRATKYRHTLAERFSFGPPQLAVLASLMLRGPETVGELRGRTGRMHPFETLEEVEAVLAALADHDPPFVTRLPRQPGQKEQRYAQLFAGEPDVEAEPPGVLQVGYADEERLEALETEIEILKQEVEGLKEAFLAFRKQFE